jgi:hypothetical protein
LDATLAIGASLEQDRPPPGRPCATLNQPFNALPAPKRSRLDDHGERDRVVKRNAAAHGFNLWTLNGEAFSMETLKPSYTIRQGRHIGSSYATQVTTFTTPRAYRVTRPGVP